MVPNAHCLTVLGHVARIFERDLPAPNSLASVNTGVIKQWLLLNPLPECEAKFLFEELRAKLPVLALRTGAALRIGATPLHVSPHAMYNDPIPTLISAHLEPSPMWVEATITSYSDGAHILGTVLSNCEVVTDERILAALQLATASRYDVILRSVFLTQLTILDSLAERKERSTKIKGWLEEKIAEAQALNDEGLVPSLANLRQGSHGAAVRNLVSRAANANRLAPDQVKELSRLASKLYNVRSILSHAGTSADLDIQGARRLFTIVLNAVISDPSIMGAS